jgi:hypothetical protein
MNFNSRLCNATGEEVKLNWHAGINIRILPDDFIDLNYRQMEDFQDGKPGSEEMKETMNHYGIFIRDPDRSYESQALEALRLAYRSRKAQYDGAVADLRKRRAAEGLASDPDAFETTLEHMGYVSFRKRMEALFTRIKFLEQHAEVEKAKVRQEIDPERTLIFLNPPKVFITKTALQMFLNDPGNEEIKEKYESWFAAQKQSEEEADVDAGEV